MTSKHDFKSTDSKATPTSPSSLPPELIAQIFELTIPTEHQRNQIPAEITLSHVSSFWRGVALTTPRLWTHIAIHSNRSLKRVATYLKRCGPRLLLDFDIEIYKYDKHITEKSTPKTLLFRSAIATYLVENIHRIRRLSIFCFHKQTLIALTSPISICSAPCLQRLVVKYDAISHVRPPRTYSVPILNGGVPMLRFLDTDMIDSRSSLNSLQNLTTLYLHSLDGTSRHTYSSFVDMLTATQSLSYLSIQGSINLITWPLHMNGPQFELANLKGLRLLDDGMMAIKLILSTSAPQLETLWLDCSFDNFHFLFDAPQVATVGGSIKFPALKYLTIPNDNLYLCPKFSKLFPTITHLHFPHADLFHFVRLQQSLVSGWVFLQTLVFTMFREKNSSKLHIGLVDAFSRRPSANGHPVLKQLLVDRDQFEAMKASRISGQIKVQIIDGLLYREAWWNKVDQLVTGTNKGTALHANCT